MGPFTRMSRRVTAGFGLAFFVVLAAAIAMAWGRPGSEGTGTQVELFVLGHYHHLQASLALGGLAAFLFALFSGGIATHLLRVDDATGDSWAPGFVVGAAGFVILQVAGLALQGAYQSLAHQGELPPLILDLFRVQNALGSASGVFLGVMLVALGVSGVLNGTIPVPLAALGLLDAAVAGLGAAGLATIRATFGTLQIVALVGLGLFVALVSVWLVMSPDSQAGAPES